MLLNRRRCHLDIGVAQRGLSLEGGGASVPKVARGGGGGRGGGALLMCGLKCHLVVVPVGGLVLRVYHRGKNSKVHDY